MRINLNEIRGIILEAILNAYEVLGVPHNASDDEIKAAWKKLALQNHPDRGGSHGKMVDINNAKDRLLNKTNLFRYGANFKGYDEPNAAGAKTPELTTCTHCGRNVAVKDGKFVGHYTEAGGNKKCVGSFSAPIKGSTRPDDAGRSQSRGDYESNFWQDYFRRERERAERARQSAPPPPPPRPSAGPNQNSDYMPNSATRYFTFIAGNSRKFWEIERRGETLHVRWGRLGSTGQTKSYRYAGRASAAASMADYIQEKLRKGYVEGRRPQGANPPPAGNAAPGPTPAGRQEPSGRPSKDSYKVYGWRQGRRVVRVGGKLYGTQPGGNLSGGGQTRFNANDRGRVSPTPDGKMRVTKQSAGGHDHTQTWDPIDEVKNVVEGLVLEMFRSIAESE